MTSYKKKTQQLSQLSIFRSPKVNHWQDWLFVHIQLQTVSLVYVKNTQKCTHICEERKGGTTFVKTVSARCTSFYLPRFNCNKLITYTSQK
ncbi:hypothetical protein FKM82_021190 [Ascaphus truei]